MHNRAQVDLADMTLHTLCKLLLAAMVPALALPGLVATRCARTLTSALLLAQARSTLVDRVEVFNGMSALALSGLVATRSARVLTARCCWPRRAAC